MTLFTGLDTFLGLFAASGLLGPQWLNLWLEQGAEPDPNGEPPPPPAGSAGAQPPGDWVATARP